MFMLVRVTDPLTHLWISLVNIDLLLTNKYLIGSNVILLNNLALFFCGFIGTSHNETDSN